MRAQVTIYARNSVDSIQAMRCEDKSGRPSGGGHPSHLGPNCTKGRCHVKQEEGASVVRDSAERSDTSRRVKARTYTSRSYE